MSATCRQLSSNKDRAIATPSHCRSGCLRASTCKRDENQAVFTATEWPRLYVGFPQWPIVLTATNQEIPSKLELQTFAEPITWHRTNPRGGGGSIFYCTPINSDYTTIRHEPNSVYCRKVKGALLVLKKKFQLYLQYQYSNNACRYIYFFPWVNKKAVLRGK